MPDRVKCDFRPAHFRAQVVKSRLTKSNDRIVVVNGVKQSAAATRGDVIRTHIGRDECGLSQGLAALVAVLVSGQDNLDSVSFEDRHDILADQCRMWIIHVRSGCVWRIVEINDSPELPRRSQIVFQPPQHRTTGVHGAFERGVPIQRHEVHIAPIEGVVPPAFGRRHVFGWNRMDCQVGQSIRSFVIVIAQ